MELKDLIWAILGIFIAYLLITWHRDESVIEDNIFLEVNDIRTELGLNELTQNSRLDLMAKTHSIKMRESWNFEHSDDNVGENIFDSPVHYWTVGCGLTYTNNQIAKCMVKGWVESPGHYANIIEPTYITTGVGVSCNFFECKGTQNFDFN